MDDLKNTNSMSDEIKKVLSDARTCCRTSKYGITDSLLEYRTDNRRA